MTPEQHQSLAAIVAAGERLIEDADEAIWYGELGDFERACENWRYVLRKGAESGLIKPIER